MLKRFIIIDADYNASTWWADDVADAIKQFENSGDIGWAWTVIDTGERKAA